MSALLLLNGSYCESRPTAAGREYSLAVVADSTGSTRPKGVLEHIGMLARKQPFAACGNLTPPGFDELAASAEGCTSVIGHIRRVSSGHLCRQLVVRPIVQLSYLAPSSLLVLFLISTAAASEPWTVAGAGNLMCRDWRTPEPTQQAEIVSWMIGFASAVNVSYASRGRARVQLDRLTNDYLRTEITSTCALDENAKEPMVDIIFRVLKELPFNTAALSVLQSLARDFEAARALPAATRPVPSDVELGKLVGIKWSIVRTALGSPDAPDDYDWQCHANKCQVYRYGAGATGEST